MSCVFIVVLRRISEGAVILANSSLIGAFIFILYFLLRLSLDVTNTSEFLAYTVGYSNGLVWAMLLGITCRVLIDAATEWGSEAFRWRACIVLLCFATIHLVLIGSTLVSSDLMDPNFSIIKNDTYQESACLASAMSTLLGYVVLCSQPTSSKRRWRRTVLQILATIYFLAATVLMQLLGSNGGPVFIGSVGLICLGCCIVKTDDNWAMKNLDPPSHPRRNQRFLQLVTRMIKVAGFIGLAGALAMLALSSLDWIDVTKFRLYSFEQQTIISSSITSRWEILTNNFWVHESFSPLFGYMFVDRITTGDGTFIHSLLAIGPHLGLLGSFFFLLYAGLIVARLRHSWMIARSDPIQSRLVVLAICMLTWSLVFIVLANFFTSFQFWFCIGLLVPPLELRVQTRPVALG